MTWQEASAASRDGIARRVANGDKYLRGRDGALIRVRGGIDDWIFSSAAIAEADRAADWEPAE